MLRYRLLHALASIYIQRKVIKRGQVSPCSSGIVRLVDQYITVLYPWLTLVSKAALVDNTVGVLAEFLDARLRATVDVDNKSMTCEASHRQVMFLFEAKVDSILNDINS